MLLPEGQRPANHEAGEAHQDNRPHLGGRSGSGNGWRRGVGFAAAQAVHPVAEQPGAGVAGFFGVELGGAQRSVLHGGDERCAVLGPGDERLEELQLPPVIAKLAEKPRGLVLVTGPTGSGKSTTLAAMIDRVNVAKPVHILTIEDPIEYLHNHKTALVNQRELHADTQSFTMALRAALREDPDVVLIGEMRDLETMEAAMKLAETGHLTMGTLHTNSAAQTITRIIDAFPAHQQSQIRTQLSLVLEGIVCQALLPKASDQGRVAALEILIATPAIRALIRDDKIHQIYGTMQTGQDKFGMQTMNQSLARLVERRLITREVAANTSSNRDELFQILERGASAQAAMPPSLAARRVPLRQGVR
jgi:twitching motility protein PilT